jgi:hypothetical protein
MATPTQAEGLRIFYSYSHEDEDLRNKLEKHLATLKREQRISQWHDRQIGAGLEWKGEIDAHLNTANIILLLISPSFLASDYCYDVKLARAMQRHEKQEARVIPIILRPCDWESGKFSKLQALPTDGKAVTSWRDRDSAFKNIAKGIRKAVEEISAAQGSEPAKVASENRQSVISETEHQGEAIEPGFKLETNAVTRSGQTAEAAAQSVNLFTPAHSSSRVRLVALVILISLLAVAFLVGRIFLLFERTFSPHECGDGVKAPEFNSHSLSVRSSPADSPTSALSVQSG